MKFANITQTVANFLSLCVPDSLIYVCSVFDIVRKQHKGEGTRTQFLKNRKTFPPPFNGWRSNC